VDIDTPNIHTPPEGHGPPEPKHTAHDKDDMEHALEEGLHGDHDHTKMEVLDRKFANGEITAEEYAASKELLLKK